jgi:hypothetical protein
LCLIEFHAQNSLIDNVDREQGNKQKIFVSTPDISTIVVELLSWPADEHRHR